MAIQLGKKKEATTTQEPEKIKVQKPDNTPDQPKKEQEGSQPKSYLMRGKAAAATLAAEEHKAEQSKKSGSQRFWLKDGDDASVTFLDGNLDADGMLDIPYYYEHNVTIGGKYGNFFACVGENEPCPICEGGIASSYVGLLTVIDHRSYESKAEGKTYKNQVRLFAAKRGTLKMLLKIAEKRDGLAGARFDVSRSGPQSPAVGSMFDFTDKISLTDAIKKYGETAVAINYDDIIGAISYPADELRKLGFGSLKGPVGSEKPVSDENDDYENAL